MARDDKKKTKTAAAPKKEAAADIKTGTEPAKPEAKPEGKAEVAEKAAEAPAGYSRGEGQKPVSKAYKDNWNAIYGKKKKKK
ncbi:MAG: hypothetical protein QOI40_1675 [Alphaproteobacteria bacterium]|jgi:hypothetical protein|nr:hypothetical protein [Alphaproteobacteria bacterium]MEA3068344.1 hypothetical protein [Sphingomonadales bacterium]